MGHKLAFIGFGVVGQGLAEILLKKEEKLRDQYGFDGKVVAICDLMKGSVYHPEGLDVREVLNSVQETGSLESYPYKSGLQTGWDSLKTIRDCNADSIVEVTFTDGKTGQPAIDHCKAAFESGKNVVMTNKGPVALAYRELSELAKKHEVRWGFEGTVMSGTPALRMPHVALAGNDINEISGIFNGTTNFILTRMEEGLPYEEALQEAQSLGYAEADPTGDVEGHDARYKAVILANYIMNEPITIEEVSCAGISGLTLRDIEDAKLNGMRWKLIARIKKTPEGVIASVAPEKIPMTDPLASVGGAVNAVTYDCDLAGPITLEGAGAGKMETGYSLLIDLIQFERERKQILI